MKTSEAQGYSEFSQYVSSSESDDKLEQLAQLKRKHKCQRKWNMERTFASTSDTLHFVAAEECWSKASTNHTAMGDKVIYRCKVKRRGAQCAAGIYLLYEATSHSVLLYRTTADHDCSTMDQGTNRLTEEMKAKICKLLKEHRTKPKRIFEILKEKGFNPKSTAQMSGFLHMKTKEYGLACISLGALEELCQRHTTPPQS